jgi:hypothetical protein
MNGCLLKAQSKINTAKHNENHKRSKTIMVGLEKI